MKVLFDGKEIASCVQQMFSRAKEIKCAVAFWGAGSETLFENTSATNIQILCNLMSGSTNPHVIETIADIINANKNNRNIRHSDTLHAKVFIADDKALLGSANASANGMALEGAEASGFNEACIYIEDENTINQLRQWFISLYKNCHDITDEDIDQAQKIWGARRNRRVIVAKHNKSLLTTLNNQPELLKDKGIFLALYNKHIDNDAARALNSYHNKNLSSVRITCAIEEINRAKGELKQNVTPYQSWKKLKNRPNDFILIDIYCGPKGGFTFHGVFHVPRGRQHINYYNREGAREFLILGYRQQDFSELGLANLKLLQEDKKTLRRKLPAILKRPGININDGELISLFEIKELIFSAD